MTNQYDRQKGKPLKSGKVNELPLDCEKKQFKTLPQMLELEQLLFALESNMQVKIGVFRAIIKGIYCISSGGVTMKNICRWTGTGCSYRTIQRFFASPHDWLELNLILLRTVFVGIPDSKRYILAVDEVVEKKAGKQPWGGIGFTVP